MSVVVTLSSISLYIVAVTGVRLIIKREPIPDMSFAPIQWQRDFADAERYYVHSILRSSILAFVVGSAQLFLLLV